MALTDVIAALTAIGVLPVITLAALVSISAMVYRRFRR